MKIDFRTFDKLVVEPVETTISFFPIAGVSMLQQAQQPQAQRPHIKLGRSVLPESLSQCARSIVRQSR